MQELSAYWPIRTLCRKRGSLSSFLVNPPVQLRAWRALRCIQERRSCPDTPIGTPARKNKNCVLNPKWRLALQETPSAIFLKTRSILQESRKRSSGNSQTNGFGYTPAGRHGPAASRRFTIFCED